MEQGTPRAGSGTDDSLRFNLSITFVDDVPNTSQKLESQSPRVVHDDEQHGPAASRSTSKVVTTAEQPQKSGESKSGPEGMSVDAFLEHLQTLAGESEQKTEAEAGVTPRANQVITPTSEVLGAQRETQEHHINGSLFLESRQLQKFIKMAMNWLKNEGLQTGTKLNVNVAAQGLDSARTAEEFHDDLEEKQESLKRTLRDDADVRVMKRPRRDTLAESQIDFCSNAQNLHGFDHHGSCWRNANQLTSGPNCYRDFLPAHGTARQMPNHHVHRQQVQDQHSRKVHNTFKHTDKLCDVNPIVDSEAPEAWPLLSKSMSRFSCAYFRR
ncbi:unnamed protein product [Notodromas monacha]|uniref:Uncharacterized protein n=1 Tax=Notodromas monacha TaxID=399045 RepID=A0A7R9BJA9_9CRUS|nr:unnamed protein product [Notodromas monacha]CAG0916508.1 unnamed protein product [Notodromas monacha]